MLDNRYIPASVALTLLAALAGCDRMTSEAPGAQQTKFPGQVSSGSPTGGQIMGQNGTLQAKKDPSSSPVMPPAAKPAEAKTGEAGASAGTASAKPSGTPGIPEGSGGTTSGTAMGGTTPAAAGSKTMDGVATGTGQMDAAAKKAQEQALAEKQKQQLEASMDRVAQRWRTLATSRGWKLDASSSGASDAGQTETSAMGLPSRIRSEKLGTAPPSEDVKQPAKDPSN